MTKQQSEPFWVAIDHRGVIRIGFASTKRKKCIEFACGKGPLTWKQLYRYGWRIKRARVAVEG